MTYLYDRAMHCPNVETIAKRRGTAQHATSLRNRRTNRHQSNDFSTIRRGRPVCLPDIKGSTHRSTPTVLLIIFFVSCMLFGLSDARAQSRDGLGTAEGQITSGDRAIRFLVNAVRRKEYGASPEQILRNAPQADLKKYPIEYFEIDGDTVECLKVGMQLPDYILDMPLWVVNAPDGLTDVLTLREMAKHEFVLLEFWNAHCKPCLASMARWEEMSGQVDGNIGFLGVAMDQAYRVPLEIERRDWKSAHVIGRSAVALSKYFFNKQVLGPMVWIKDGRLFGITQGVPKDMVLFKDILEKKLNSIPSQIAFKPY